MLWRAKEEKPEALVAGWVPALRPSFSNTLAPKVLAAVGSERSQKLRPKNCNVSHSGVLTLEDMGLRVSAPKTHCPLPPAAAKLKPELVKCYLWLKPRAVNKPLP